MAALQMETTATAVVARIDHHPAYRPADPMRAPSAVTFRWSNAGHPPPLLVTDAGEVSVLGEEAENDLLLGLDPRAERREHAVTMPPGTTVVLYTDGVVERRGEGIDEGIATLAELLGSLATRGLSLEELCDQLLEQLVPAQHDDDIALLAVRLTP